MKQVYIKTFGCVQNSADSERVKAYYWDRGYEETGDLEKANLVVINTCIIRESAENRAYGLIDKVNKLNSKVKSLKSKKKIVVTGCLVGANNISELKKRFPMVDEFLHIKKISYQLDPIRDKKKAGLVNISSGCDNHCSFCIVPMSRGAEVSRKFEEVMGEVDKLVGQGFKEVVLIGQNVNSYGNDFGDECWVHMGKKRIKSKFPELLAAVASRPFEKVSFVSSNPWDYSDELIETIAKYPNIDRLLHLPVQSGDDEILKRMNRSYTAKAYIELVKQIRAKVKEVRFTTDIIIGFPGESEEAFKNTVKLCKKVGFEIAYLNKYSPRKGTVSTKIFANDIPMKEKKRRWVILNELVNKKTT